MPLQDFPPTFPQSPVGPSTSTTFTSGSVVFAGPATLSQDNPNFFYDASGHRFLTAEINVGTSFSEGLRTYLAGSTLNVVEQGSVPGRTLTFGTTNARNVNIQVSGGNTWTFGSLLAGGSDFYPASDAGGNIGIAGTNRVASIFVATGITLSSLTPGQVLFPGTGGLLSGSASLFWDTANALLKLTGAAASNVATQWRVTGDTFNRFQVAAGGSMSWGGGSAAPGVVMTTMRDTNSGATGGPYDWLRFTLPATPQTYQEYFAFLDADNTTRAIRITQAGDLWVHSGHTLVFSSPSTPNTSGAHIVGRTTPDFTDCWVHELATIGGYNFIHNNAASNAQVTAIKIPNTKDYSEVTIHGITRLDGSLQVGTSTTGGVTSADVGDFSAGVVVAASIWWDASAAAMHFYHTDQVEFMTLQRSQALYQTIGGTTASILLTQNGGVGYIALRTGSTSHLDLLDAGDVWISVPTNQAMQLRTNNTSRFNVTANGCFITSASLATNMTTGFINIPGAAGAPSGTPVSTTGYPLYYDQTNKKIYIYDGGWKKGQVTGVDVVYA